MSVAQQIATAIAIGGCEEALTIVRKIVGKDSFTCVDEVELLQALCPLLAKWQTRLEPTEVILPASEEAHDAVILRMNEEYPSYLLSALETQVTEIKSAWPPDADLTEIENAYELGSKKIRDLYLFTDPQQDPVESSVISPEAVRKQRQKWIQQWLPETDVESVVKKQVADVFNKSMVEFVAEHNLKV